ncbi:MAG: HIT family protein [Candidatus Lokiarchaeota archaeon]|nr:HIT family protein [Candidatus Lokiarchaeota archaeon]
MKDKGCIFCKIIDRKIPSKIIFENNLNLAFLDIFPISRGHTIVIPKNHYTNLEDIPDDKLFELFKSVKQIATIVHKKLKIDGYNILQNNYKAAGQDINHFHVHIIPRNLDDNRFIVKIPRNQATEDELNSILAILKS